MPKSSKFLEAKLEIESEKMGGGNMEKNSYESRASSSRSKFNGVVRVLECWCLRICVVRKSNTSKNL